MITVIDNFLPEDLFESVHDEVKGCKLISLDEHKNFEKLLTSYSSPSKDEISLSREAQRKFFEALLFLVDG